MDLSSQGPAPARSPGLPAAPTPRLCSWHPLGFSCSGVRGAFVPLAALPWPPGDKPILRVATQGLREGSRGSPSKRWWSWEGRAGAGCGRPTRESPGSCFLHNHLLYPWAPVSRAQGMTRGDVTGGCSEAGGARSPVPAQALRLLHLHHQCPLASVPRSWAPVRAAARALREE